MGDEEAISMTDDEDIDNIYRKARQNSVTSELSIDEDIEDLNRKRRTVMFEDPEDEKETAYGSAGQHSIHRLLLTIIVWFLFMLLWL